MPKGKPKKKTNEEKTLEILLATERVADQIITNKREILELSKRKEDTREALKGVRNLETDKAWIAVGGMMMKMQREEAERVLEKDRDTIDADIERLRNEQVKLVQQHRDLEHLDPAKGFDLRPLDPKEASALRANHPQLKI